MFYVRITFFTYWNYFPTYIKLLTTRSVEHFELHGHDFWKETLLMKCISLAL